MYPGHRNEGTIVQCADFELKEIKNITHFLLLKAVLGQLPLSEIVPRIIAPPTIAPDDNCPQEKLSPDNCPLAKKFPPKIIASTQANPLKEYYK